MLRVAVQNQKIQSLLNLACTISFGLPAIALGAVPLVAPASLRMPPRSDVRLSIGELAPARRPRGLPVKYIIGADVSGSFSPKRDLVTAVLSRLLRDHGLVAAATQPHDQFQIFAFARGTPERLREDEEGDDLDGHGRSQLLQALATGALLKRHGELDVRNTDILGFVHAVCSKLQGSVGYHALRLIVFSDFLQSPAPPERDIAAESARLRRIIEEIPNFTLVAFKSPPAASEPNSVDVLPALLEAFGPGRAQMVDLDAYAQNPDAAAEVVIPYLLQTNVKSLDSLELVSSGSIAAPRLLLEVPPEVPEFDEIFFGLLPAGENHAPVRVRIPLPDGMRALEPEKSLLLQRAASAPRPIGIEVEGLSRFANVASGNLLVAVPARGFVCTIPLSVSRFDNSAVFRTLVLVLFIFNLVPLGLSILMIRSAGSGLVARPVASSPPLLTGR